VTREWSRAHAAAMKDQFYREIAKRYTVRVASPVNDTRPVTIQPERQ